MASCNHHFCCLCASLCPGHILLVSVASSLTRKILHRTLCLKPNMEITIGQVSGVIAAIVFVVQHLFPNALVLLLVCVIGNQHSAVTWSVVGRHINNSLWPTLLRSDTSASDGVYPSVSWLKLLRPLGLGLIGAAAVVTPLGLYDAIIPNKNLQNVAFAYLQDTSPLGYGTMQDQGIVWFNRRCSGALSGLE